MQKKWVTSKDDKVRQSHNDNANQGWIDIDEVFA
jgi:hypothetical protein